MQAASGKELNRQALEARTDERKLEQLIRQDTHFILGCANKTIGRYVTRSDDEWSVALIAFHEAVQAYDASKGEFHQFAALVIRRRLIDHLNRESRTRGEVPVDLSGTEQDSRGDDEDGSSPIVLETRRQIAEQSRARDAERSSLKEEIEALTGVLSAYDITFPDLERHSPKAKKTKTGCAVAVRALVRDPELMAQMRRLRSIPATKLQESAGVQKNILEKHRKYIIAAAEILYGDYPYLAEYLQYIVKGGEEK
jgi:RNA polymerase sigma factor